MSAVIRTQTLGYPRIGQQRELKKATEAYWKGETKVDALLAAGRDLRRQNWLQQRDAGIDLVPVNDFSFYDQVLDMSCLLGVVPARFHWDGGDVPLDTYFQIARGIAEKDADCCGASLASEMTKWFDTNYHYIVPEFTAATTFKLSSTKVFDEFAEAKALGVNPKPVLIGPVTYLWLGKVMDNSGMDRFKLIDQLLPVYCELLQKLAAAGAEWIQIDEPALVMDLAPEQVALYDKVYAQIRAAAGKSKLIVATYFGDLRGNLSTLMRLPVDVVHVDVVRVPQSLDAVVEALPQDKILSLGVVDGRNIWRTDFERALNQLRTAQKKTGADRLWVAPSCSLIHTPVTLRNEGKLDAELKGWLAFAEEKLAEVVILAKTLASQDTQAALASNATAQASRRTSPRIHSPAVKERCGGVKPDDLNRRSPFNQRADKQQQTYKLPAFPTTTIGSFPQTKDVRSKRAQFKAGTLSATDYDAFIETATADAVKRQEAWDIDVLVHGEFERNDMVEYFGEQLSGFAFTANGWVQSYGSRYVKPPFIFGDVSRPAPMTVRWSRYAQSLTRRPMKGMLTGPVTILQWSFVRDDQPRSTTCMQIALALRDEVRDLESGGIGIIQIDEPAIREGLPLRRGDWVAYLRWSVDAFRLSSCGVRDETQIHTHMCYSEFNDIIVAIAEMDADVISIETSRSKMDLLDAFVGFKYPNQIGPGVYDIHSPRVPTKDEMVSLLHKAAALLPPRNLWVNPDCGLKTRQWAEVEPALVNMVAAAKELRH